MHDTLDSTLRSSFCLFLLLVNFWKVGTPYVSFFFPVIFFSYYFISAPPTFFLLFHQGRVECLNNVWLGVILFLSASSSCEISEASEIFKSMPVIFYNVFIGGNTTLQFEESCKSFLYNTKGRRLSNYSFKLISCSHYPSSWKGLYQNKLKRMDLANMQRQVTFAPQIKP